MHSIESKEIVSKKTLFANEKNKKTIAESVNGLPPKKKRGPLHVFRVAMYMIRNRKSESKGKFDAASSLKNFFGSMRPLHIQTNNSPPSQHPSTDATLNDFEEEAKAEAPKMVQDYNMSYLNEKILDEHAFSPEQASTSSSSCQTSQFASVTNLQELDEIDENDDYEDDSDCYYDDKSGDDMIDEKAEEFIAKFYAQMKIQNVTCNTKH